MPSTESSPRPWRVTHPGEIEDANGELLYNLRDCIGGGVDEANARLIVDAVNERERLRDVVRRLITIRENIFWRKDERTGLMYYDTAIDEEDARKTIEEARAAVGGTEERK